MTAERGSDARIPADHARRAREDRRRVVSRSAAILATMLAVLVALGAFLMTRGRDAWRAPRIVEGRLLGAAWGPFDPAAAPVRSRGTGGRTRSATSAGEVRVLLANGSKDALEALLSIPRQQYQAATWNDLAAVYIRRAAEERRPAFLVDAITSADAALDAEPLMPEARFNRALAIERLGLRDLAAAAWRRYLLVDPSSEWAVEARAHLAATWTPLPDFKTAVQRELALLQRGDADAARRLIEISPEEARVFVEMEAIRAWAETLDSFDAPAHLTAARTLANALAARGDRTMAAVIETIERAGPQPRRALASAHLQLIAARAIMRAQPTEAEPNLRAAQQRLASLGSPAARMARLYVAISAFEQGRRAESAAAVRELLTEVPDDHRSLRAMVLWQLALSESAEARWSATLHLLRQSGALFERIAEPTNAAFVRQMTSEVYDAIGDYDAAWHERAASLPALGRRTTLRTRSHVSAIAYSASDRGEWAIAESMLNLDLEIGRVARQDAIEVLAFVRRAVARHERGNEEGAAQDLANARRVVAGMSDAALRSRAEADVAMVASLQAREPQQAIAELTRAAEFHATAGREMYLPAIHLERARMYLKIGDVRAARSDFDAGIARLERDRETIEDPLSRFGIFDTAGELFREAIDAALDAGDVHSAFDYAERARARALLDTFGGSARPFSIAALPADTALIAFTATKRRLVIFGATRDGLDVAEATLAPEAVASSVRRMLDAMTRGNAQTAQIEGRKLFDALLAPLPERVRMRRRLAFVPSSETAALPFAALRSPSGRFLVEDHVISTVPSASLFVTLTPATRRADAHALIVAAAAASAEREALPAARAEARDVSRVYPRQRTLLDEAATTSAILAELPRADVVHFAGHGSARDALGDGATVLVTYDANGEGELTPQQIASVRLPRKPLVVIAACESGRGEVRWSEGTLSMARAFLAAGAPSVVASLWQIDDEASARFFPRLHHHLARGLDAAEALRETQLEFISGSGDSTWAAVQLTGR